eukprot:jgi/Chlat1/3444/Chrsp23S03827
MADNASEKAASSHEQHSHHDRHHHHQQEDADDFDKRAAKYDEIPGVVQVAKDVAATLFSQLPDLRWDKADVLDLGAGTGNVALDIARRARSVMAIDPSQGMLKLAWVLLREVVKKYRHTLKYFTLVLLRVLEAKAEAAGIRNVKCLRVALKSDEDLVQFDDARFDVIVSSLVMHHIEDVKSILRLLVQLLRPGGVLAIFDFEQREYTNLLFTAHGAHHIPHQDGFSFEQMTALFTDIGLWNVRCVTACQYPVHIAQKGATLNFPIMCALGFAAK